MPEMFTLATRPRHQWGTSTQAPADIAAGRPEQRTWSCLNCALKRITVLPFQGEAYRAYRIGSGPEFEAAREPVCSRVEEARAS